MARRRLAWPVWGRKRPVPPVAPGPALPWWGLILSTEDRQVVTALLASAARLRALREQPGWGDVERILTDWITRYQETATTLGQTVESVQGTLRLTETDSAADDRRRLIASAQAAALKGLRQELASRAEAPRLYQRRQQRQQTIDQESGALV